MLKDSRHLRKAIRQLTLADPILGRAIHTIGPFTLKIQRGGYQVLVRSIISQQISVAAARTIRNRLQSLLPGGRIRAAAVNLLSDDQLQLAGISQQKRSYLRELTRCTLDGTINFRRIAAGSDEAAIAELVQVKGIGRWTAQMYLLFSLGRPDVFAPDDLGLRNAMRSLYSLSPQSTRPELEAIAAIWAPYRSVASWYLWRTLDQNVIEK